MKSKAGRLVDRDHIFSWFVLAAVSHWLLTSGITTDRNNCSVVMSRRYPEKEEAERD